MSENAKLSGTDLEPAELAALHERFDAVTEAMTRMERRLEALQGGTPTFIRRFHAHSVAPAKPRRGDRSNRSRFTLQIVRSSSGKTALVIEKIRSMSETPATGITPGVRLHMGNASTCQTHA